MKNVYQIVYSSASLEDLRNIYRYIRFDLFDTRADKKTTERIRNAIRELNYFPERHTQVDWEPWCSLNMRKMPVGNYVVFYIVGNDTGTVTIIRIFYSGQNIKEILQDSFR